MSVHLMDRVWKESPFDKSALLLLLAFADASDDEGWSWVSLAFMEKKSRLSRASVFAVVTQLEEAGWLQKHHAIKDDKPCIAWRVLVPSPNSGLADDVNNSVGKVVERGKRRVQILDRKSPKSGQKSPNSGLPPHPLKGGTVKNRYGTVTGESPEGDEEKQKSLPGHEKPKKLPDRSGGESAVEAVHRKAAVTRVFEHYCEVTDHNPRLYTLTDLRLSKGMARLQDCLRKTGGDLPKAEELLLCAVDGLARSEFHAGKNQSGRRYNDWIDNLMKSAEQIEKWLEAE